MTWRWTAALALVLIVGLPRDSVGSQRVSGRDTAGNIPTASCSDVRCLTPGDANADGKLSAADLVAMVTAAGGRTSGLGRSDANCDGLVDATDISSLFDRIFDSTVTSPACSVGVPVMVSLPADLELVPSDLTLQPGVNPTVPVAEDGSGLVELRDGLPVLLQTTIPGTAANSTGSGDIAANTSIPVFLAITNSSFSEHGVIGVESTAVALVFLGLHLYAQPRAQYEKLLTAIAGVPEVVGKHGLSAALATKLAGNPAVLAQSPPDTDLVSAVAEAVIAARPVLSLSFGERVTNTTIDGASVSQAVCVNRSDAQTCFAPSDQQSGVHLSVAANGSLVAFNQHKRWDLLTIMGPGGSTAEFPVGPTLSQTLILALSVPATYAVDSYGGLSGILTAPSLLTDPRWLKPAGLTMTTQIVLPAVELYAGVDLSHCSTELAAALQNGAQNFAFTLANDSNSFILKLSNFLVSELGAAYGSEEFSACAEQNLGIGFGKLLGTFILNSVLPELTFLVRVAETVDASSQNLLDIKDVLTHWVSDDAHDAFIVTVERDGVWTTNGPDGLNVWAVALDPLIPGTIYTGALGGMFRSTNGGASWTAVSTGLPAAATDVYAIAIDPQNPNTLYVGTGYGLFKSTDRAASWVDADDEIFRRTVDALAIDPVQPTTLYRGEFPGGVFKSTNSGATWFESNVGLPHQPLGLVGGDVFAIAIDPSTTATLYAGTNAGVFKTTDGGADWSPVNTAGLASTTVFALSLDPQNPDVVYAGTGAGVFRSSTGGASWIAANSGLTNTEVLALTIDPSSVNTLYAGTFGGGVFKSSDAGTSWNAINDGLSNLYVRSLAIDPSGIHLHAGTSGGGVFDIEFPASLHR